MSISVWEYSPETSQRPGPDWTKTAEDQKVGGLQKTVVFCKILGPIKDRIRLVFSSNINYFQNVPKITLFG